MGKRNCFKNYKKARGLRNMAIASTTQIVALIEAKKALEDQIPSIQNLVKIFMILRALNATKSDPESSINI